MVRLLCRIDCGEKVNELYFHRFKLVNWSLCVVLCIKSLRCFERGKFENLSCFGIKGFMYLSCFGIKGFKYLSCFGIKCKRFKYFSLAPSANNVDWGQDLARFGDLLKYILGRVQRKVSSLFQGMGSDKHWKGFVSSWRYSLKIQVVPF